MSKPTSSSAALPIAHIVLRILIVANWLMAAVEAMGQHKPFFQGKNLARSS